MFYKKSVLKKFAKFTGNACVKVSFLIKLQTQLFIKMFYIILTFPNKNMMPKIFLYNKFLISLMTRCSYNLLQDSQYFWVKLGKDSGWWISSGLGTKKSMIKKTHHLTPNKTLSGKIWHKNKENWHIMIQSIYIMTTKKYC